MINNENSEPSSISPECGHTRWKRFTTVFALSALGAAGLLTAMANGALAASFAVSGGSFGVTAESLTGQGLVLYGNEVLKADGTQPNPVATMGIRNMSEAKTFCTALVARQLPMLGTVTVRMSAPSVSGNNLMFDVSTVDAAKLELKLASIGIDASKLSKGPDGAAGPAKSSALEADSLTVTGLKANAWAITAGTISLNNLKVAADHGEVTC